MAPARYGQHFLIDKEATLRIIDSLLLKKGETVLEIGPGRGALTMELIKQASKVLAVEVDPKLVEDLRSKFGAKSNFHLHHQDFLAFNLSSLLTNKEKAEKIKVVGNLPYNLTSPILRKLSFWDGWDLAIVMVQKEVGDRLSATVGSKQYGALSVGMSLSCESRSLFHIGPNSFRPRPKIDSSIVELRRLKNPLSSNIPKTQRVIQAAFQQRRKTILNSLSHGLGIEKKTVAPVLSALKLSPTLRAENLDTNQFVDLSTKLEF